MDTKLLMDTFREKSFKSYPEAAKRSSKIRRVPEPSSRTVLDQLYRAYAESHERDPQEIGDSFKELEEYLCVLPLNNNNAVFNLCCHLCCAYERKAFLDGLQYGAALMLVLGKEADR